VSHVFLVGFMGAGKSTVGRALAKRMEIPFADLDARIEASAGSRIDEIFAERGERVFRELETAALLELQGEDDAVVACGGGTVMSDENRRALSSMGCVVYLQVTPEEAMARIGDVDSRPLLAGGGGRVAASLLEARRSTYESVADITVDTVGATPEAIVESILGSVGVCGAGADG
jgi:shikimate kinase